MALAQLARSIRAAVSAKFPMKSAPTLSFGALDSKLLLYTSVFATGKLLFFITSIAADFDKSCHIGARTFHVSPIRGHSHANAWEAKQGKKSATDSLVADDFPQKCYLIINSSAAPLQHRICSPQRLPMAGSQIRVRLNCSHKSQFSQRNATYLHYHDEESMSEAMKKASPLITAGLHSGGVRGSTSWFLS